MIGIALGVAALIVVLSVMNGFQKELRSTILGVVSHVQIFGGQSQLDCLDITSTVNHHYHQKMLMIFRKE